MEPNFAENSQNNFDGLLGDIDREEVKLVAMDLEGVLEPHGLITVRRSRVRAELEQHRLAAQRREGRALFAAAAAAAAASAVACGGGCCFCSSCCCV